MKILTCTVQNDIIVTPVRNIESTSVSGSGVGLQEGIMVRDSTDFKKKMIPF